MIFEGLAASVRLRLAPLGLPGHKGHLIFGRMSEGRYDPCAFDTMRRKGADAPVVRVDHEQILSFAAAGAANSSWLARSKTYWSSVCVGSTRPHNKELKLTKPSIMELRSLTPVLCGRDPEGGRHGETDLGRRA